MVLWSLALLAKQKLQPNNATAHDNILCHVCSSTWLAAGIAVNVALASLLTMTKLGRGRQGCPTKTALAAAHKKYQIHRMERIQCLADSRTCMSAPHSAHLPCQLCHVLTTACGRRTDSSTGPSRRSGPRIRGQRSGYRVHTIFV